MTYRGQNHFCSEKSLSNGVETNVAVSASHVDWGCVYMTAGLNSTRVETNLGWDLSCIYKRRVGIKREEFNKPFSYNPCNFFEKGSSKVHDEPFQPGLNCLPEAPTWNEV